MQNTFLSGNKTIWALVTWANSLELHSTFKEITRTILDDKITKTNIFLIDRLAYFLTHGVSGTRSPAMINDGTSHLVWTMTWAEFENIRVLSTGFSNLPLQVLSSVSFHPSGHSLRHSPVTEFLTYRHTLQFVARGVLLEVLRHPKLLVINKYLFSSFVKT